MSSSGRGRLFGARPLTRPVGTGLRGLYCCTPLPGDGIR